LTKSATSKPNKTMSIIISVPQGQHYENRGAGEWRMIASRLRLSSATALFWKPRTMLRLNLTMWYSPIANASTVVLNFGGCPTLITRTDDRRGRLRGNNSTNNNSSVMQKPTLLGRANAPTPKFFRKLRTIGITIGAIGTAIIAAPVALPVAVITAAGYLVTVGSVVAAVSQLTVHQEPLDVDERF
jgi:hypothetical protein